MNRNEKLLEAIGQIDDSLVLDAMEAGNVSGGKVIHMQQKARKKKAQARKAAVFRFQGALAACAVLAICLGIYGLLAAQGMLIGPFGKKASTEMAVESTADMARAMPEEAVSQEAAPVAEEAAVPEAAFEVAAYEAAEEEKKAVTEEAPVKEEKVTEVTADEKAEPVTVETESTETVETEIETVEADPEVEVIGNEMELALLKEPMVMSLRPVAEEVSGTELAEEPTEEENSPLLKAALFETAGTDVTLTYSNDYETAAVTYGSLYTLELQTEEGWTTVPALENIAWEMSLHILEPGKTAKETVLLSVVYGDLQAGHYRLVKNCTVEHTDQDAEEIVIYTEFDIVK